MLSKIKNHKPFEECTDEELEDIVNEYLNEIEFEKEYRLYIQEESIAKTLEDLGVY